MDGPGRTFLAITANLLFAILARQGPCRPICSTTFIAQTLAENILIKTLVIGQFS